MRRSLVTKLAGSALLVVMAQSATGAIITRDVELDLGGLASPSPSFSTPIAAFAGAPLAAGDTLIVNVSFANGERLVVGEDGGSQEILQWQFDPNSPGGAWSTRFDFTGVQGSLLTNGFTTNFSGAWGPFNTVNLTDTSFSFSGITLTTDVSSTNAAVTLSGLRLDARTSSYSVTAGVPAPAPLGLLALGLLAAGIARGRVAARPRRGLSGSDQGISLFQGRFSRISCL